MVGHDGHRGWVYYWLYSRCLLDLRKSLGDGGRATLRSQESLGALGAVLV
jgi:hypothetical protein